MKFMKFVLAASLVSFNVQAFESSDKLLLTGGVNQLEGSAGGGLTPWALIGGYGTQEQIGANAFYTNVAISDYNLVSTGALVGIHDRVELSYAHQSFDTKDVGTALGLGYGFKLKQSIFGIKVKLIGDAVLDQDSWLPQIAFGIQYKKHEQGKIVRSVGAKDDKSFDFYLAGTKIFLAQSILANVTLRATEANQLGILGYGGDRINHHQLMIEGSVAYLLTRKIAVGVEYRTKPNNLNVASEDAWFDAFVAWAPMKNVSATLAYAYLGNIVLNQDQSSLYTSIQLGF
ncbi:MAG: hypothetical protein CME71_03230 [Halobacteriovorax sp.]|nr:hypothetical protein [Halobacteriovorax sp.]|tara:strand:+ start:447 stop:1307 length:861 start_codon:yes stop_codon:yes gene_type:complete